MSPLLGLKYTFLFIISALLWYALALGFYFSFKIVGAFGTNKFDFRKLSFSTNELFVV
jgi:hypothetical protein